MDSYRNSHKRIRGCIEEIDLFWDEDVGADPNNGKRTRTSGTVCADGREFLALLEDHVEAFDPVREEEDLRLAGKEQLINKVVKSLEQEIGLPTSGFAAANSCLQSDSAVSMATSSSRLSDPEQLNMGNECICTDSIKRDQLGYSRMEACNYSSNEQIGTVPISPWSGKCDIFDECLQREDTDNSVGGLERIESSAFGSTELADLGAWDFGGLGVCEEGFKMNLKQSTF